MADQQPEALAKPVGINDHPEHHMQWTPLELAWIAKRDQQWRAELSRLQAENETLRDSVAAKADRIDRLGEMVERLQADLEAEAENNAAFDQERAERIKAQGEAKALAAMVERLQAAGGQGVQSIELALCESQSLVLREGVPYRFVRVGGCEKCAAMSEASREAYGEPPLAHPPAAPASSPYDTEAGGTTAGMNQPAAPALVPLTDEQANKLRVAFVLGKEKTAGQQSFIAGIRAAEAHHGINGLTVGGDGGVKG